MQKKLVIIIKALIVCVSLMILTCQLALLAQCLSLSELPLQNAAGTLSILAFFSLFLITISYRPEATDSEEATYQSNASPKPTSRVDKYYAPLLEMLVITALVNLSCTILNNDDIVEPYASSLVLIELGQTVLFGVAAMLAWILGRRRKQKMSSGDVSSGKDVISEVTGGNSLSLKESISKPSHSIYAPTY